MLLEHNLRGKNLITDLQSSMALYIQAQAGRGGGVFLYVLWRWVP